MLNRRFQQGPFGPKARLLQGVCWICPSLPGGTLAMTLLHLLFLFSPLSILYFFRVFALTMHVLLFFSYVPVLLIFLNLGTIASAALSRNAACYYPDGHQATGDFACFLDQDQSPCCGSGSICEESGLCKVAGSIGVSNLIRGTCTDQTWASSACSIFCKGSPIRVLSLRFLVLTSD